MRVSNYLHIVISLILVVLIVSYILWLILAERISEVKPVEHAVVTDIMVYLPLPRKITNMSVEEAILLRRSIRDYTSDPIRLEYLAMILWAAYGITEPRWGFRASPSAGATYPLEVYVVIGEKGVLIREGEYLKPGVYRYDVHRHLLILVKPGDVRRDLATAALGQEWVENAPVNLVICAVFERTTTRYGERGRVRYVPMEVGHLGQNVYLMATALGYGVVVVGAFYDDKVQVVINARSEEIPMYIIPIGVPREPPHMRFEDIWEYIEEKRSG